MPADVCGHTLYDQSSTAIHDAPRPGVHQSAAGRRNQPRACQDAGRAARGDAGGQVTIEGEAYALPPPFMVFATQNPIEQEGTYALPEAQLDRFLLKMRIDYPSHDEETVLVRQVTADQVGTGSTSIRLRS